jgi:hypothetical protein
MVQEANATRAKARGKRLPTRSPHPAAHNSVDTSLWLEPKGG